MKVITIATMKGGTGKTATAAAIWAGLNMRGYKSIALDLDPQCNLSDGAGAATTGKTVFGAMTGEIGAVEAIQTIDDMDVIAGSAFLSAADNTFTETGKEYRLKELLEPLKKKNYDFCIIDTPPSLNVLTVNALTASDSVIIPVQSDINAITGLTKLYYTVDAVRKYFNPGLQIEGVLLTRYNPRTTMSREVLELLDSSTEQLGTKLFNTKIRDSVKVAESAARKQPLLKAYPTATAAQDYNALIDEILNDFSFSRAKSERK